MEVKPGYKQTEVGVIPEDWDVYPVRQQGIVVTGKALAIDAPGLQRPYLRTKNVFDGRIDVDDVLTMPMTDEQFAQFRIRNGDVLLNEGQSIELVGRCAIYRDEYPEPCAIQNALLRFRARAGVSETFASYLFRHCQYTGVFARIALQTTSVAHLGGSRFERLRLAWPTEPEQRAIATALSDVDGLLGGLDRLIAKKRDLKQAAMQQLLTGKTRLPGFRGEWDVKTLGGLGSTFGGLTGKTKADFGEGAAHYVTFMNVMSNVVIDCGPFERVKVAPTESQNHVIRGDLLFNGSSETPEEVAMCAVFRADVPNLFLNSFCFGFRFRDGADADGLFLAYYLRSRVGRELIKSLAQGSTRYNLSKGALLKSPIRLPTLAEQTAIAEVLMDMDAELAALEQRREKTRALKLAMMQELLTGHIRLVEPQVSDAQKNDPSSISATGHSWAFNEAVVIATLVRHFGAEDYPLGRKRYTKLSYLLHRHAERRAEGYLKKAAGPYNPKTKYGGPEKISMEKGYIREHKVGKYHGFVAAANIDEAESYFEKWYGPDAVQWLDQFRFKSNDDLEVLATVDMAAEELRASGRKVDLAAIKDVIRGHREWNAKLNRDVFSDANIANAIKASKDLIGAGPHA